MNRSRFRRWVVLSVALLCLVSSHGQARTWTSKTGKFRIEASFVAFSRGVVVLRRDDSGKQIRVPFAELYVDDQKWVMEKTGWGRVWASSDGRKVIADFKSADQANVTLELLDGRTVTSAISRFSPVDVAYIKSRTAGDEVDDLGAGDEFSGKVVSVTDGDTIAVLYHQRPVKVRLEGIDAPETTQAFSKVAKTQLSKLVFGNDVFVVVTGRDKYDRVLGVVSVAGRSVNDEMVRAGLAWHYTDFSDDEGLANLEREAKAKRIGIWSEPGPIAPWEWRRWGAADRMKWLADRTTTLQPSRPTPTGPSATTTLTHWLTTNSGIRHNASCRWYQNSNGRQCSANDGRACKICGG